MSKKNGTEINHTKRHLRVELTMQELLNVASDLAANQVTLAWLKSEQKRIAAEMSAKIKGKELDVQLLTAKIQERSEYRDIDCAEHLDTPIPGRKTIVRIDTGEHITIEDMTAAEMQRNLEMEPAA